MRKVLKVFFFFICQAYPEVDTIPEQEFMAIGSLVAAFSETEIGMYSNLTTDVVSALGVFSTFSHSQVQ